MSVLTAKFDTRIELQELTQSNVNFELTDTWATYKYTYATITKKSGGSTTTEEGSDTYYNVYEVYIRWDDQIEADFRKYRIKHKTDYYRIIDRTIYERNKTLTLVAVGYDNE